MKNTLKLEEAALFVLSIIAFSQLPFAWWWYPALFLLPDVSMLGYLVNPRVGAMMYNIVHHKAIALFVCGCGFALSHQGVLLAGIILFGHSAFDRILGYGLKYSTSFQETHLGTIGGKAQ